MYFNEPHTIFRRFSSVAAIGFLLWTLSSSTFVNVSSAFVEKKLNTMKEFRDRTAGQLESVTQHLLHW
jgi:hypothetical protein